MSVRLAVVCLAVGTAVACGSSSSKTIDAPAIDAEPTVDAFYSLCGHPGDVGNELGVGKFCKVIDDCPAGSGSANLCSSLGNDPNTPKDNSFFCTIQCTAGDNSPCGTNAACKCGTTGPNAGNCACAPPSCTAI